MIKFVNILGLFLASLNSDPLRSGVNTDLRFHLKLCRFISTKF